jgi:protein-histidine pros-kinase
MNLLLRLNLALGVVFGLGALASALVCRNVLDANAQHEALEQAALMMDSALSIRDYTQREIVPLLQTQMKSQFLPQSVPFYAATQNFLRLHEARPLYEYDEPTLNPTNPRDRATDWEADLIAHFRNEAGAHQLSGERDTPMGRSLYLARPIRAEASCMLCHSLASTAPRTVTARYGRANGFGWQVDEVIGAQVVSVPTTMVEANARAALHVFLVSLGAVFLALLLAANAVLYWLVVRPVRHMAALADRLSRGDVDTPEFPTSGGKEIATLGRSFNRLRISIDKALRMLDGSR